MQDELRQALRVVPGSMSLCSEVLNSFYWQAQADAIQARAAQAAAEDARTSWRSGLSLPFVTLGKELSRALGDGMNASRSRWQKQKCCKRRRHGWLLAVWPTVWRLETLTRKTQSQTGATERPSARQDLLARVGGGDFEQGFRRMCTKGVTSFF